MTQPPPAPPPGPVVYGAPPPPFEPGAPPTSGSPSQGPAAAPFAAPLGPPERRFDGFAVASLVLGLLALGPLAVLTGVIGLVRATRPGLRGVVIASMGLVLGLGWSVVGALLWTSGAGAALWTAARHYEAGADAFYPTMDLQVGDCLQTEALATSVDDLTRPCSAPHDGEVAGSYQVADAAAYPGVEALEAGAAQRCPGLAADALAPGTDPAGLELFSVVPTAESWQGAGDRTVLCLVTTPGRSTTGSLLP